MKITETGSVLFDKNDYVFLPSERTEKSDEIDEQFFKYLSREYFNSHANYEVYHEAQALKKDYHKELLGDKYLIEVDTKSINEDLYYDSMFASIMEKLNYVCDRIRINNLSFKNSDMFSEYIRTIFTPQSLKLNVLLEDITVDVSRIVSKDRVGVKKYVKNMKITRFLVSLFELADRKDREIEKLIGKFRIDPSDKTRIFISSYLPSFINSGLISNSCLSPDGSNAHSTFMTLGYKNLLVVHTEDFSARAWLAVDYVNKNFTLAHTYPQENFLLQITVIEHLTKMGFKPIMNYFRFPEYMDMSPAGIVSNLYVRNDNEVNKDSYHSFSASLFGDDYSVSDNTITPTYSCSSCDKSSADPRFMADGDYCQSCYENNEDQVECHSCGEYEHSDYMNYDEETDASYCNHCHERLEEEREDERRREEEEEEEQEEASTGSSEQDDNEGVISGAAEKRNGVRLLDINLELGTNLIRRHSASNYFNIVDSMGSNLRMNNSDLDLLLGFSNKISNYRERLLFLTMMQRAGVNWKGGERPLHYNPGNDYPYYIGLYKEQNAWGATVYTLLKSKDLLEGRPSSEKYIRYFYLYKNWLHTNYLNRAGDFSISNFQSLTEQESNSWLYWRNLYTYSKFVDFDKNITVSFENQRAYDMFRLAAHFVGYTNGSHTQNAISSEQFSNFKNQLVSLNNKGIFTETYLVEGAAPTVDKHITEQYMLSILNLEQ